MFLLRWDASIALISRQPCVLPYTYFETVLSHENNDGDKWTFFDLNGCPRELIVPMMQLANLAVENEPTSEQRSLTAFALTDLVEEIEASLKDWKYKSSLESDADDDAEAMQADRDHYHCCEAWRYALLIYVQRVFRWQRGTKPPARLTYLARVTIDHLRSCRPSSQVQKQALLPAWLAGAETMDLTARQHLRDYCTWWYSMHGYQMFSTVSSLLEELWAQQDVRWWDDDLWWGEIVDEKHSSGKTFCFG